MGMNKVNKGNMYDWLDYTFNPIRGQCKHDCAYCSIKAMAKRFDNTQPPINLVEKELSTQLGKDHFIFVGSSVDMFAEDIENSWILKVLEHCNKYPDNKYLFQSKNPCRMLDYLSKFPKNSILGTTIESNINHPGISKAPPMDERAAAFMDKELRSKFDIIVTVEPILSFDLPKLAHILTTLSPKWINIGADSKGSKLPEPSKEKVLQLIENLKGTLEGVTEIKIKDNLKRIIGD